MTTQTPAQRLALELETLSRTSADYAAAADHNLEALAAARVRFFRHLAKVLAPALPVLIDRGGDAFLLWSNRNGTTDLWLARDGSYRSEADNPPFDLSEPLDDAELGQLRVDAPALVAALVERLRRHAAGRASASNKLEDLAAQFSALSTLLGA